MNPWNTQQHTITTHTREIEGIFQVITEHPDRIEWFVGVESVGTFGGQSRNYRAALKACNRVKRKYQQFPQDAHELP